MQVVLLNKTDHALSLLYKAARTCYSPEVPSQIPEVSVDKMTALLNRLQQSGHHSVFEHASFTFSVEGISRACSHQLVRHRMASYSAQSQRYVQMDNRPDWIVPPSIFVDREIYGPFERLMWDIEDCYHRLIAASVPAEDARYVLPNATPTNIVVTMNLRELVHFCSLRLCLRAQWEIRDVAYSMKQAIDEPFLSSFLVPPCKTCGQCKSTD